VTYSERWSALSSATTMVGAWGPGEDMGED
jgi:hypothetical protein